MDYAVLASVLFGLAGIWSSSIAIRPRWIIKLAPENLSVRDLVARQESKLPWASIRDLSFKETYNTTSGAEGIGYQKVFIVKTDEKTVQVPLPTMAKSTAFIEEQIRLYLANNGIASPSHPSFIRAKN